ncbi:MAG: hypothetical protein F6J93_29155 [Oscillatoria sp. SIO1A7]|nr:hypothetical protein [Oscillatoria sp. SIO1A7]
MEIPDELFRFPWEIGYTLIDEPSILIRLIYKRRWAFFSVPLMGLYFILGPIPDTRHPTPHTRHPTPDTRHPNPQDQSGSKDTGAK